MSAIVSVIIPVFNQWSYTDDCLKALELQNDPEIELEIIVVDNASTDFTSEGLAQWSKQNSAIKVFRLETNSGFSPACNYGAQLSTAPFLLFLNNDTIPQSGWLQPLLNEIQNYEVGIAAPKLLYPDAQRINHAGYVFGRGNFYGIYHNRDASLPAANIKRDYQALLGACIIIGRELFFELGQFAEYGLEDIDLCLKVTEKNLKCRYVPESVVLHHGSVTLKFSEVGSFPITDVIGFSDRWGNSRICWDDYKWYIQDSEWPAPAASSDFAKALENANKSVLAVIESKNELMKGNYADASALIDQAFQFWPHNPMAYSASIQLLAESGQPEKLIAELQKLPDYSFDQLIVNEIMPILSKALPPEIWNIISANLKVGS